MMVITNEGARSIELVNVKEFNIVLMDTYESGTFIKKNSVVAVLENISVTIERTNMPSVRMEKTESVVVREFAEAEIDKAKDLLRKLSTAYSNCEPLFDATDDQHTVV